MSETTDPPRWRWLITHAPGDVRSHTFTPEATRGQVRLWHPGAMAIAPEGEATTTTTQPYRMPT
jgi:hypothetical protein